ncbi:MAG: hypothetical protein Kow0069_05050 [Promethearchaeota archaeon]
MPKFHFKDELVELVARDVLNCIGCNRCMDACPVTKEDIPVGELNEATTSHEPPRGAIKRFALNCVQCARCVPVCPPGARRDLMMLLLKWRLVEAGKLPAKYNRYVVFKRPRLSRAKRAILRLRTRSRKDELGSLFGKVDRFDDLREAELLFYPGCYAYNPVARKTVELMEYLGEDYEVLAGYQSCCGWPQYLQGRVHMATTMLRNLWELVRKVKPKRVITTCAECYAALRKIRAVYASEGAEFEPMSTTEWLAANLDKFPVKFDDSRTFTLHESCHLSRKFRFQELPRRVLSRFGRLEEMDRSRDGTACCFYYNFDVDPNQEEHRLQRLEEAKARSPTLVVDCVTCLEVYREHVSLEGLEVVDFNELFHECASARREGGDGEGAGGGGAR